MSGTGLGAAQAQPLELWKLLPLHSTLAFCLAWRARLLGNKRLAFCSFPLLSSRKVVLFASTPHTFENPHFKGSSPVLKILQANTSGFPRQVSLQPLNHTAAWVAQGCRTTILSVPTKTQIQSWTNNIQKPLSAVGCRLGPRGWQRRPDPTAEARCRRSAGAPLRSLATCDADVSPTRLPIAAPRNLRHPVVAPGSPLSLPPPSSPTFCRPLRCARTACRLPPVLCKAKVVALLGRK